MNRVPGVIFFSAACQFSTRTKGTCADAIGCKIPTTEGRSRNPTKRKNLYEVETGSQVYYIHVSPVTGIIYLLAEWENAVAQSNAVFRLGFPCRRMFTLAI
jgi:hypothetical protein